MIAIRAVFDGKTFIPQEPVSLPADSEAIVLVDVTDNDAQQLLDRTIQDYYQSGDDAEDEDWGRATAPQSQRAWDED